MEVMPSLPTSFTGLDYSSFEPNSYVHIAAVHMAIQERLILAAKIQGGGIGSFNAVVYGTPTTIPSITGILNTLATVSVDPSKVKEIVDYTEVDSPFADIDLGIAQMDTYLDACLDDYNSADVSSHVQAYIDFRSKYLDKVVAYVAYNADPNPTTQAAYQATINALEVIQDSLGDEFQAMREQRKSIYSSSTAPDNSYIDDLEADLKSSYNTISGVWQMSTTIPDSIRWFRAYDNYGYENLYWVGQDACSNYMREALAETVTISPFDVVLPTPVYGNDARIQQIIQGQKEGICLLSTYVEPVRDIAILQYTKRKYMSVVADTYYYHALAGRTASYFVSNPATGLSMIESVSVNMSPSDCLLDELPFKTKSIPELNSRYSSASYVLYSTTSSEGGHGLAEDYIPTKGDSIYEHSLGSWNWYISSELNVGHHSHSGDFGTDVIGASDLGNYRDSNIGFFHIFNFSLTSRKIALQAVITKSRTVSGMGGRDLVLDYNWINRPPWTGIDLDVDDCAFRTTWTTEEGDGYNRQGGSYVNSTLYRIYDFELEAATLDSGGNIVPSKRVLDYTYFIDASETVAPPLVVGKTCIDDYVNYKIEIQAIPNFKQGLTRHPDLKFY